jgi:small subunit ribosomal protein S7
MSRKGQTKPRIHRPDALYQSVILTKIINYTMKNGNKLAAQKQVYAAMDILKKESKSDDVVVTLEQAFENIKPKVEVRPKRIGGAVYQVPAPVRGHRQDSLAIRWLITSSRKLPSKQHHTFASKLATELLSALKSEGASVGKRLEVEKMADANKAFAHLRW